MPQSVGIVDVFVPGHDLIQPLADERVQFVCDVARVSCVSDPADHIGTEPELFIEFSNEQQAGICGERAAGKINDEFRLESEAKFNSTPAYVPDSPLLDQQLAGIFAVSTLLWQHPLDLVLRHVLPGRRFRHAAEFEPV